MQPSRNQFWTDSARFRSMCEAVLAAGKRVRFHVRGQSMQPNLLDGDAVIVEPARQTELRRGEIILCHDRDSLRVHRLVSENSINTVITRGDASLGNDPDPQVVLGRVIAIERGGIITASNSAIRKLLHAARRSARRLKLASAVRLRKLASRLVLLSLLPLLYLFWNVAPAAAQANLAVTETATPNPVAAGGQISYAVTIVNSGTNNAANVTLTMVIPASTTFVSAARTGGNSGAAWTCTGVAVGGTGTETCSRTGNMGTGNANNSIVTFVVQVNAGIANGQVIAQSVTGATTSTDSNLANNTATSNVTVQTPDLSVTNAAAPNPVSTLANITYTQVVTNNGPTAAVGTVFTQTTPANTTFQSITTPAGWTCGTTPAVGGTGTITCTQGTTLASGASSTFTLVLAVTSRALPGSTISDTVSVSQTGTESNLTNNTATTSVQVNGADLSMTQVASASAVAPGATITYTETVTNNGPNSATNAVLYQQTPADTTFQSVTPPAGWTCGTQPAVGGTGQIICTDGAALANGGSGTFTVVVTVAGATAAGTVILNSADVTATTADPVATNNASTTSVLVENAAQADLAVSTVATPTPVFISSTLTYSIVVNNLGLVNATTAQLVDTIPTGTTFVSSTTTLGSCSGTSTVTCAFGTLNSGSSATVTITVTTPATPGTLTNTATASYSGTDPVTGNNTATTLTVVQPLVCASPGRDGAGSNLTGILNAYYPPASNGTVAAASTSIVLGPAAALPAPQTPIAVGDLLLIIQMQDAAINSTNTGAYGDGVPGDPGFGSTALNNAGNFEFVTATSAVPVTGGTLNFLATGPTKGLLNTYTQAAATATQGQRRFQIIRVPQYTSATLNSTTPPTALAWNGATGGVLAIDVASQFTLSGTLSVDGVGFRGGAGRQLAGAAGTLATDYITLSTTATNGSKGEGFAGTPRYVANATLTNLTNTGVEGYPNGSYARGAPGNAGGGATDAHPTANDQNSGGGGGGNGGVGGQGGFGWNSAGIVGGYGGAAFPSSTSSLVMGGGAGAGTTNNGTADPANGNPAGINSSGAAGGGILIIHAGSVTGTGTITANGQNAIDVANDGGGGGGGGGSIRVLTNTGGLAGLTVNVNGGVGGDTWLTQGPENSFPADRHGPGGGGAGGAIYLSSAPAAITVNGGAPGVSTTSRDPYGATIGTNGVISLVASIPQTPGTQPGAECASADIVVTNSGTPNPVLAGPGPGNIITYTQVVTNNGPLDALGAVFNEAIPANTTFQSINVPVGSGWSCTTPPVGGTGAISCNNPDFASAASTTFTVTVAVNTGVAVGTVITDVINASSGTVDPILSNNSAAVQTTVGLSTTADLSITNTASPNPVLAGNNITDVVVVTNNGAAAATSVVFSEPIPANTTFVSVTPSPLAGWTCGVAAGTLTCSNPTLAAGASASFNVVLTVAGATPAGTVITDTASVASSTTDPNPNNNSATATVVVATAGQADLNITSAASPNPVSDNNNITYTQVVTNSGPAASGLVTFTDTIPANTNFVSFTPPAGWNCGATIPPVGGTGTIVCTIASLAINATASFPLVVQVNSGVNPGTSITNTPTVNVPCSSASDPNCANNSASTTVVVASPTQADVAISKNASPDPVDQGTNLTYSLQVTNNGPAVALNVKVSDPLPAQVTFVSVSTTQGTCTYTAATTTVSCSLGSLSVGNLAIITINVTASTFSSATLSTNTATVSSDTGDPNLVNNTSSFTSTIAAPTSIQLVSFRAEPLPQGGVLLEWKTREEVRNLGFNVYREDATGRHRLNPSLIAGSALVLRGGQPQHAAKTYQWMDTGAAASAYWLEDVDLSGARILHGPAEITPSGVIKRSSFASAQLLAHVNRSLVPPPAPPRRGSPSLPLPIIPIGPLPPARRVSLYGESAVKISVRSEGWYHVTGAQLVAAGLDPSANARTLHLYAEGIEQPLLIVGSPSGPLGPSDAIEFYGTGIDTPYSDTRVYWLVDAHTPGKRILSLPAGSSSGPTPASFPFTVTREDRTTYFAALLNSEDSDNFFGAVVTSDPVDQDVEVVHSAPADLPITLDITLQGATEGQDHAVSVSFNGSFLGNISFTGQPLLRTSFPVDASLLHDGSNTVTLAALNGDNDVSVVQSIALRYAHIYQADSNWLRLQAASGSHLRISGFSNSQIRVFDITNPSVIEQLSGAVQSTSTGFTVDVTVPGSSFGGATRQLLALSNDQLAVPFALTLHCPSAALSQGRGGDILIVAHPDFVPSLAPLVALRQQQGHTVQVVTIDDVFDYMSFGERSPYALRNLLALTQRSWSVRPQYLLLVGDASLDPRDYLGFGDFDFVPTRLIDTAALKTASDDWFTDFDQSGFATIPTGRLPVRTAQDADLVVSKIVNYESGSFAGPWNGNALVVADQNIGVDFSSNSKSIADSLGSSFNVTSLLTDGLDPATARQQLVDALNQGQAIVNYSGHGSVEQWSFSDLFDNSGAAALQNANRLPVFVIMDCLNGFFHDVFSQSLAESLILAPNGGAVAVWASSGFTDAGPQASMNRALIQSLVSTPTQPLGRAVLDAKKLTGDPDVRRTWILFGDPAMLIQFSSSPVPAPLRRVPNSSRKEGGLRRESGRTQTNP